MSELTKEYFEGYIEAKFNEKLANVATKDDLKLLATQESLDKLAQITAVNFERVETRLTAVETRLTTVETELSVVGDNVKGLQVEVIRLGIGQDKVKKRLDAIAPELLDEEYHHKAVSL